MNRPFGVPALAGVDRLKAGLQTSGVPTDRFLVPMRRTWFSFPPPHISGYFLNGLLTFGKDREPLVAETLSGGAVSRRKFSRMAR